MAVRYLLEIYTPGSPDEVSRSYESNTPFLPIARGDRLTFLADAVGDALSARVIDVEHIIRTVDGVPYFQKMCIFTAEEESPPLTPQDHPPN